jgi:hypothetical protein
MQNNVTSDLFGSRFALLNVHWEQRNAGRNKVTLFALLPNHMSLDIREHPIAELAGTALLVHT